jgi:MFS family permease
MKDVAYKRYLLGLLLLVFASNNLDRLALGIVAQNIKVDLSLTDTELGLLSGIAFALFYSVMGIPIARWADRGNRVTIIAVTTALWSVAVALCGAARSFLQLALIRSVVAVGEAGCMPPANSLIPDYFSRAERPRAMSIYMLGASVAVVVGYFLAGWFNEFYGWRRTFVLLGLPGLPLAVVAALTLREPRQMSWPSGSHAPPVLLQPVNLRQAAVKLSRNASFRHLLLSFSIAWLFNAGIFQWLPTFFIRSYHLSTGELGTWFAVIYGVGGLLGTYIGGEWASRRAAGNEPLQLKAMTIACSALAIISTGIYLTHNRYVALALMGVTAVVGPLATGPLFAAIQTVVPQRLRATSIAIIYLFANLIGTGLGPLGAGVLSDLFRPLLGDDSLRYALLALCPGYLWAAWHLWHASKTITLDAKIAELDSDETVREKRASLSASAH